jgi:hypothetical protein
MLITTPIIGRLFARPRLWAYEHLKAGDFGPAVYQRGRADCVDLAGVETFAGQSFTPAQLIAAAAGITKPRENA